MFKYLLFILVAVSFVYILISLKEYTIYTDDSTVKYKLTPLDEKFITKHGKLVENLPKENGVFFTNTKWNSNNSNHLKFKNNYILVEPGYYYYNFPDNEYYISNSLLFMPIKKNNN